MPVACLPRHATGSVLDRGSSSKDAATRPGSGDCMRSCAWCRRVRRPGRALLGRHRRSGARTARGSDWSRCACRVRRDDAPEGFARRRRADAAHSRLRRVLARRRSRRLTRENGGRRGGIRGCRRRHDQHGGRGLSVEDRSRYGLRRRCDQEGRALSRYGDRRRRSWPTGARRPSVVSAARRSR